MGDSNPNKCTYYNPPELFHGMKYWIVLAADPAACAFLTIAPSPPYLKIPHWKILPKNGTVNLHCVKWTCISYCFLRVFQDD